VQYANTSRLLGGLNGAITVFGNSAFGGSGRNGSSPPSDTISSFCQWCGVGGGFLGKSYLPSELFLLLLLDDLLWISYKVNGDRKWKNVFGCGRGFY